MPPQKRYPLRLILLATLSLFACSPYFMRPVDDLYQTLGEHFGGLVITGNAQEFCVLLTEEITNEHLPWWNPLATCSETLMAEAVDAALDELTPGGIVDLETGYDDSDGLDEYFALLAAEYALDISSVQPITPGLSLYDRVDLPTSPFYWAGETVTDQYQIFAFDGPTDTHLWGAYCLAFTEVGSRTVIADIRLGCCYDGFTVCSQEACDRCPGGPPPADYCDSPGPLQQEAEAADLHGTFETFSDGAASGGQAIRVTADVGGGTGSDHHADFCFDVTEEGVYRLEGRFLAENNDQDSFYVTVNGMPTVGILWDMPADPAWQTDFVTDRNDDNDIVEISLTAGSNLVRVYHRERDTWLDWLRLERQ
jgi:hypothetical protein